MNSAAQKYYPILLRVFRFAVIVQIFTISFSIAASSIGFGLACFAYAGLLFLDRRRTIIPTGLERWFGLYLGAVALMCLFALFPGEAWFNSRRVLLIAVVYFLPLLLRSETAVRRFILALGALTAAQSIVELVYYYSHAGERLGFLQIYMTTAGIKMIILLVVIPLAFEKNPGRFQRLLVVATSLITAYALVLTETRSSWLGFIAGILVVSLLSYRQLAIPLAAAILAVLLFMPGHVQERIRNMFQTERVERTATIQSNLNRVRMWRTGLRIWRDHPLTGVGDANMCVIYRWYVVPNDDTEGCHLHNNYIHLLATHGAIGLTAVLVLFAFIVLKEWRLARLPRGTLPQIVGIGSLGAFVGFFINGMAEYNFGDHEILVLLWMSVGLAVAVERIRSATR